MSEAARELSVAVTGAGGAGVISCGELLLQAWARCGGRGLLRKAFGPQIRGGESAALLKLTPTERYTAAGRYDLLVALDWVNFSRFQDEIRVDPGTLVICDQEQDLPDAIAGLGAQVIGLPLQELASATHPEGRVNMLVTGLLGSLLEIPSALLVELAAEKLAGKPAAYREAAAACIEQGAGQAVDCTLALPPRKGGATWYLTGNQAAAFSALEAGIRFVAAYPITPASDVLEWLAGGLEQVGGELLQAEDELAAINMVIGAAYGGVPAMTATSGPGLALMTESIGLAVASETPLCILDVMRGGPSTGIPTKSEQGDLNIALYGLHGDAPHLVLAPLDIADCVFTVAWSIRLAQGLQVPALVLSDQFIGQSSAVVSEPRRCDWPVLDSRPPAAELDYLRYRLGGTGVSPAAVPGDPGQRFTADGLEHNERGTPSASQSDHSQQLDKRRDKLLSLEYGPDWGRVVGQGALGLVCFGSAAAAAEEAAELLQVQGVETRTVALRLLAPLPAAGLIAALEGCSRLLVVEQNHGAQLYHYLRSELALFGSAASFARPGPVPLAGHDIARYVLEELQP